MNKLASLLAVAALAVSGTAVAQPAQRAEARLARMLEGRVAGEPVGCISAMRSDRLEVLDRIGVVYDAGDTVYLARASNPESLRERDVLVIERTGGSLCRYDVRHTIDRSLGHITSVVFLEEFVPYRRAG